MIKLIDKFYNELQEKFQVTIDAMIGSLVISGNDKKLIASWDEIIEHLDKKGDELDEVINSEDDSPLCEDYIKMAALYVVHAIMAKLDEKFEITGANES